MHCGKSLNEDILEFLLPYTRMVMSCFSQEPSYTAAINAVKHLVETHQMYCKFCRDQRFSDSLPKNKGECNPSKPSRQIHPKSSAITSLRHHTKATNGVTKDVLNDVTNVVTNDVTNGVTDDVTNDVTNVEDDVDPSASDGEETTDKNKSILEKMLTQEGEKRPAPADTAPESIKKPRKPPKSRAFTTLLESNTCFLEGCGVRMKDADSLELHLAADHNILLREQEKGAFRCDVCSTTFQLEIHMRAHKALRHSGAESPGYKCFLCAEKFCSARQRDSHLVVIHNVTNMEPVTCDICGRGFGSAQVLRYHYEAHSLVYYKCTLCIKSFRSVTELAFHKKHVHQKQKKIG